eukprot:7047610-Pyramimonas_sp.AAC.1
MLPLARAVSRGARAMPAKSREEARFDQRGAPGPPPSKCRWIDTLATRSEVHRNLLRAQRPALRPPPKHDTVAQL